MFKPLLALSALLLLGTAAQAAPDAPAKAPAPAAQAAPLVCPVTGETIASIKEAVGSSVYAGKTYYFCCSSCKPAFDKNPQKYVKSVPAAVKPKS